MLLRYIVSNFKSIGHAVVFSLLPTENISSSQSLQSIMVGSTQWDVLQKGVLLGPNGAGKTSFIESLYFARNYVVKAKESGKDTGVNQFRANLEDLKGRSSFQFMFYADGQVYDYGFSLDEFQVYEEWLMQVHEDGFNSSLLFARITYPDGNTEIEADPLLVDNVSEDQDLVKLLIRSMQSDQKNQLFLSRMFDHGIKKAKTVVDWFKSMQFIFPETKVLVLPLRLQESTEMREYFAKMLCKMETGVIQVSIASKDCDLNDVASDLSLPEDVASNIRSTEQGIFTNKGKCYLFLKEEQKIKLVQIKFIHRLADKEVQFNLEEESNGTQRLVDLLPMLFRIEDNNSMYFVDELDRSLHPKLVTFFIEEFANKAKNSKSQLVFTTHDVHLLNSKTNVLCQEEFWLIDKSHNGETSLTSLSSYEHREGQDNLKAYMNGRFGAIPF